MPYKDGTGPYGQGPMTGRGMGICAANARPMRARGMGRGYGFRHGMNMGMGFAPPTKEMLQSEKVMLEAELKAVEEQLAGK